MPAKRHATDPPAEFADCDLIGRVLLRDDRTAFAELVRRHKSALRASLRRMTGGNAALSDDIAQETFILACRNIGSFLHEAKFSTWLYRIAFNAWQSEIRRRRKHPLDQDFLHEAEVFAPESEHTGVAHDVARAMVDLTDGERAAILQCYYNDLSHEEAAYVLGMPLGTVKTNVLKAKAKMRVKLNAYAQDSRSGKGAAA